MVGYGGRQAYAPATLADDSRGYPINPATQEYSGGRITAPERFVDRTRLADRLDVEFNAPIEILSSPYESIRLTDEQSAKRLREIGGIRVMERGDGHLVALFESRYRLQRIESDEPDLMLDHIVAG